MAMRSRVEACRQKKIVASLAAILGFASMPGFAANIVVQACSDADIFHAGNPPLFLYGLRSSVGRANSGDTIDMTRLHNCTITLTAGAIPITVKNLSFVGPSDNTLTIDGNNSDRVFNHVGYTLNHINPGVLMLSNMTITHGKASGNGGCIQSVKGGTVDLFVGVTITGCSASGKGGGIAAPYVQTNHSTISNNVGGGIYASGTRTSAPDAYLENSTISGNTGGAGVISNPAGYTYILTSTIAYNTSSTCGGIDAGKTTSQVDVRFSNVTGNSAGNGTASIAGGICGGTISLYNATASYNDGGTGGVASYGKTSAPFYGLTVNRSTIANNIGHLKSGGASAQAAEIIYSTINANKSYDSYTSALADHAAGGVGASNIKSMNSTISGNYGQAEGGIVASQATIFNSTIAFNKSYTVGDRFGGGIVMGGFGCARTTCSYSLSLYSTIVANNTVPNNVLGGAKTAESDVQLLGNGISLNTSNSLVMASNSANSSITADPLLLPLANNGGTVQTHALGPHSPALGVGSNPQNLGFDERGSGFSRSWVNGQTDIGAYQTQDRIFYNGFQ